MKKPLKIILVYGLTLICFSCYYNEFPELEDIVIDPEEEISFSNDILPIFEANDCAQCHNPAQQEPDLTPANAYNSLVPDYVNPGNANSSSLFTTLNNGHRDLDATSLEYIKEWINRGANPN